MQNLRKVGENSDPILSRLWTSLEVVEKPSKCKRLLASIFVGGMTPTFLRQFVRATYYPLLEFRLLISVREAWQ